MSDFDEKALARIASRARKRHEALTRALKKATERVERAKDRLRGAESAQRLLMEELSEVGVDAFEELDRVRRG